VQAALKLGRKTYVSPTTSDIALLRLPALKMGPGDSARSHSADEFVYLSEVEEAIGIYGKMIESVAL
jgi:acetylornithine deacetylase